MSKHDIDDDQIDLASAIKRFGCPTILLADDSLTQQYVISYVLQNAGLTVDCVDDGQKAIDKIALKQYDIVLMDIQMPILDGIAATKHIRRQFPLDSLSIIALTGDTELGIDSTGMSLLFNAVLHKPVDSQVLIQAIILLWINRREVATTDFKTIVSESEQRPYVQSIAQLAKHPCFDLSGGVYEWVGEAAYLRVLKAFVRVYTPYAVSVISKKYQTMTLSEQHRFFHKLKSAAANIGAMSLLTLIDQFEQNKGAEIEDINHELIYILKQLSILFPQ